MTDDVDIIVKGSEPAEEKERSRKTDEESNPKKHGSEVHGSEAGGDSGEGRTGTGSGSKDS